MTRSIFLKMFISIAILITAVVSIILMLYTTYFEKYYKSRKVDNIESEVKSLALTLSESDLQPQIIQQKTFSFAKENESSVFFVHTKDSISDKSLYTSGCTIEINSFNNDFFTREMQKWEEIYNNNIENLVNGNVVSYEIMDSDQRKYAVSVSTVTKESSLEGMIFSFTSMQPIAEATIFVTEYYVWVFVCVLVLIVVLAYWFSKVVSRPLIKITQVASNIANLDFSQRCTVHSKDELGKLSDTINSMSDNLSSALNKLESDLETRKDLVTSISHELKTPISVIQGYADGIADGMENGTIKKEYIDIIVEETRKMNVLVDDMLNLSQLESSGISLDMQPFSICRLIDYAMKKYKHAFKQKEIETDTIFLSDEILVYADGKRIEQVVSNLLSNAIKHTPSGGNISISVQKLSKTIEVTVFNSGLRIQDQDINKIWDKFYRVEKSRNKLLGGTGLGLSIVKNILLLHQSDFGVRNTDTGVEFYFTLHQYK